MYCKFKKLLLWLRQCYPYRHRPTGKFPGTQSGQSSPGFRYYIGTYIFSIQLPTKKLFPIDLGIIIVKQSCNADILLMCGGVNYYLCNNYLFNICIVKKFHYKISIVYLKKNTITCSYLLRAV